MIRRSLLVSHYGRRCWTSENLSPSDVCVMHNDSLPHSFDHQRRHTIVLCEEERRSTCQATQRLSNPGIAEVPQLMLHDAESQHRSISPVYHSLLTQNIGMWSSDTTGSTISSCGNIDAEVEGRRSKAHHISGHMTLLLKYIYIYIYMKKEHYIK